jgi:hypothetical protein
MANIAENLLVQLVERQPDAVDLVVVLDTSTGREGKFPVTDIPKVMSRIAELRAGSVPVLDIDGILIEHSAWEALSGVLGYFMGSTLGQFTPADYE